MNAAHPAELRDDELHHLASAIFAGPLPCDRDERWSQAAILDELAARPLERTDINPAGIAELRQLAAQLRGSAR